MGKDVLAGLPSGADIWEGLKNIRAGVASGQHQQMINLGLKSADTKSKVDKMVTDIRTPATIAPTAPPSPAPAQDKADVLTQNAVKETIEKAPINPNAPTFTGTPEERQTEIQGLANAGHTFTNADLDKYYGKGLAPASDYQNLMDRNKYLQSEIHAGNIKGRAIGVAQEEIRGNLSLAASMQGKELPQAQAKSIEAQTALLPKTHEQQFAENLLAIGAKNQLQQNKLYTALSSQMEKERKDMRAMGKSEEEIETQIQADYPGTSDWVKSFGQNLGNQTTNAPGATGGGVTHKDIYNEALKSPHGINLREDLSTPTMKVYSGYVGGVERYFDKEGNVIIPQQPKK